MKKHTLLFVYLIIFQSVILGGGKCPESTDQGAFALVDWSKKNIEYQFVNLDKSTERREVMEHQLNQAKVKYSRISAIYGKGLSEQAMKTLISKNNLQLRTTSLTPAEIALYVTTSSQILPKAMSNSDGITVTFEDDVVIPFDLEYQFRQALKAVPKDGHIFFLGCYQSYKSNSKGVFVSPFTPNKTEEASTFTNELCPQENNIRVPGTPWVKLSSRCTPGTWAYAVHDESAKILANKIAVIDEQIDLTYQRLVWKDDINVYCLNPELVRTTEFFPSTIR